jgi:hypothetical protein
MEKSELMYSDPSAARYVTNIKGWVDTNNRFWGDNPESEHMARYSSCTHRLCECGNKMEKSRIKCQLCSSKAIINKYNAMPAKLYNGEPIYSESDDVFFWSDSDLDEYCSDNEKKPSDLMLVFCVEDKFNEVNLDDWYDQLPQDIDHLPKALIEAVEELNKVIRELPPACYRPSNTRVIF